jgi:hypothetical protein
VFPLYEATDIDTVCMVGGGGACPQHCRCRCPRGGVCVTIPPSVVRYAHARSLAKQTQTQTHPKKTVDFFFAAQQN